MQYVSSYSYSFFRGEVVEVVLDELVTVSTAVERSHESKSGFKIFCIRSSDGDQSFGSRANTVRMNNRHY